MKMAHSLDLLLPLCLCVCISVRIVCVRVCLSDNLAPLLQGAQAGGSPWRPVAFNKESIMREYKIHNTCPARIFRRAHTHTHVCRLMYVVCTYMHTCARVEYTHTHTHAHVARHLLPDSTFTCCALCDGICCHPHTHILHT